MEKSTIPMDATAINEMYDAIGALVFALTLEMPAERRTAFSQQLARLASSKNASGSILAGTCLLDFARAAELAAEAGRS